MSLFTDYHNLNMIICLAIKNKTYCLCISLGQQSLQLLSLAQEVAGRLTALATAVV